MIIFTSVCANYVHKARSLAQSVKRHIPDAKMILCLVEKEIDPRIPVDCFDDIVLAKDAWNGNFDRFIFKHAIVEASTSVKGQFFRYLMDRFLEEDKFVYLDPDCYVYGDFVELKAELDKHPIVLCPHLLKPGNIDMELSSTAHGVYNLGFLGISRSEEGRKCVDWWAERLYLFCYDDIQRGIFTDQKWFDLVPCFFDAKVFKHHGYDFAPWSLMNSSITKDEAGNYYVEGDPLRFIHFSGYGRSAEDCMDKWMSEEGKLFRELYQDYCIVHDGNDADRISKTPWGYSNYTSGEKIEDSVRHVYRSNWDVMFLYENPFEHSNKEYRKLLGIGADNSVKQPSEAARLMAKAKVTLRQKGLGGLIKAFFRWLNYAVKK